jgi:hypothetical protein
MSATRINGGFAFPSVGFTSGMTLRDYFAGQALAGFCAAPHDLRNHTDKVMAIGAYRAADAMLAARKAKP